MFPRGRSRHSQNFQTGLLCSSPASPTTSCTGRSGSAVATIWRNSAASASGPLGFHGFVATAIYQHDELFPGARFEGPAIVQSGEFSAVIGPGQTCSVDPYLNLFVGF